MAHSSRQLLSKAAGKTARFFMLAIATAWLALGPGLHGQAIAAGEISQDEFDKRVHDYILAHPEVIMQALQSLDARQREADAKEAKAVLAAKADEVFRDPTSPVGGNAQGNVTMTEFFDYNCPYCRQVAPLMAQATADDPQLRIVYKEFPILGPDSVFAAKAALAANKQGKYAEFHKALFAVKSRVNESIVLKVAADVGLDVPRLRTDMQQPEILEAIEQNVKLAQALKINGTPGFVVGDQIFPGATDLATMKSLVEQARSAK
ncbi:DsbA family protein [Mesorhizobium sp. M7A.F.Ca.US.011.01.1.1]|uniref:DsbA family protein n=1 Tax=Mesorhizobium sp. M7A.F.Ca.US.011.01.1.1 TaxID=2496741 RepID=UPI000FC9DD4F|nr:DsbA family protein [Mesorhizobium sp. M7A.F.Ca.US.011.01.1.1]RUX27864.1 DsbA family protein [Mesorhizobium sp. M7A.F.Ca.US.011.01.1.1]